MIYKIFTLCPNKIKLKYIPESSRYDVKTYNMLEIFLQYGNIRQKLNGNYYQNICYLDKN